MSALADTLGQILPSVNASLNGLSALLLLAGYRAIRRQDVARHRRYMLAAFGTSLLFLVCYLVRVALTGTHRFPGEGLAKAVYLTVLTTHMLLAALVPVLAVRAIHLGLGGRREAHRRVVRYAWPAWMYVSVTGIVVYLMLYHWPR